MHPHGSRAQPSVSGSRAGGMGTVYRARDGDGRVVALKLLHAHLGADPEARERLTREVDSLRRVRHPGVARVLDAEIDSSDAFVVTELVKGQDLAAHVRTRGPLPTDELAELADRLRAALVVVHRAGVLHRDLTPGNVMVTDDGPVLIDFGVAQAVEDARVTSTGLVAGTPGYLAPELLEGGQPSAAGDWWGWAALLVFAATGRPPFGRGTVVAQLNRARTGEVDLAGVDRRAAAALRSALAVDPWHRAAPEALVAELRGAAARAEPPEPEGAVTVDNQWRTRVLPVPSRPSAAEATDDDWPEDDWAEDEGDADEGDADEGDADEGEWPRYDTGQDYIGMGPEPAGRRGTVLAAAAPLVALALARPGTALAIGLVLAGLVAAGRRARRAGAAAAGGARGRAGRKCGMGGARRRRDARGRRAGGALVRPAVAGHPGRGPVDAGGRRSGDGGRRRRCAARLRGRRGGGGPDARAGGVVVADDGPARHRMRLAYRCAMAGRGQRRVWAWLAPAVVAAAALLSGAMGLAEQGTLTVQQCVSGAGLGRFGLGLALLRVDEACPDGTLAVGGGQRQVIGVVVVVAMPVLDANLAGATHGLAALARLHRLLRLLRAVVAGLGARSRRPAAPPPLPAQVRVAVDAPVDPPTSRAVLGVPWWRGPPPVSYTHLTLPTNREV